MASYYSIVQYIADAAKDERVNIGVVTFGNGRIVPLFTDNWTRVKHFTRTDTSWLRDIARDARLWDEEFIRHLAANPFGSIHLTEPSASILSPEDLAFFVGQRLLTEDPVNQRGYHRKSDVVRVVKSRVREKLRNRFGAAEYHRMIELGIVEEGMPYELLDGQIVRKQRNSAGQDPLRVSTAHCTAVLLLGKLDREFEKLGCYFAAQQPISLTPFDEPSPDGAIIRGAIRDYAKRKPREDAIPRQYEP